MATANTNIQIYETLRQKLGSHETEALVDFVDTKLTEINEHNAKTMATKEDLKDLELALSIKIADSKTDFIRWVFAFFLPLLLAILGLYVRK